MSERTTKREVEAVFERLCQTVGVPMGGVFDAETRSMSRGWSLEYNGVYGGWCVAGHSGKGTGESSPLGEYRMPSRQFVQAMHFAIRAIEASKEA